MLTVMMFLAGLQAAPAAADPLAPARAGKLQCHAPNAATKSCRSLATYAFAADGTISNKAEVLLAPQMGLIMTVTSSVAVKNGAVCGALPTFDQATFVMNGQPAHEPTTQAIRQQLGQAMAPMVGKEICTTYKPDGDGFTAEATMGGQPAPGGAQKVIWVAPTDGYKVAP